jgi:ElaB/YqjD/DUF883 family membrane-anchored ribosome-binding protein
MATDTHDYTETVEGGPQRLADAAGDIAQQATSVAEQRASSTMTQVGDTLEQVAQAVRGAGDNIRTDQPQLAGFADTAAGQVDRAAQYLREHDAREVIDGAQDFARRQPAVVVGAGLALGLLVGRALKSANGASRSQYGASDAWRGTSPYGAQASYRAGGHTSSAYAASGGDGASDDDTGGAGTSSIDPDDGQSSTFGPTSEEGR